MPLKERTIVDLREEIARLTLKGYSVTEVGQRLVVSRPTVRLWRDRFLAEGKEGLEDRSHAPARCPHRTGEGGRRRFGSGCATSTRSWNYRRERHSTRSSLDTG